jgi:peptidoglycan/xylan/chitin deacetylase (PgdA/CDA1 family)
LKCTGIVDIAGLFPPKNIMMTSQEVRTMHAAGMSIGAHTRTHPILTSLDEETAMKEIGGGKSDLESILGSKVSLFAYPNGKPFRDYNSTHVEMVRRAGFAAAVSTAVGSSDSGSDVMQLPRFTPWDQSEYLFCIRLLRNINRKVTRV